MSISSGHTRIQLLVHVHVYDSDSYKAIAPDINSLKVYSSTHSLLLDDSMHVFQDKGDINEHEQAVRPIKADRTEDGNTNRGR